MSRALLLLATVALLVPAAGCGNLGARRGAAEYVIRTRAEASRLDDRGAFAVVSVDDGTETPVAAVREPDGRYYLPTVSRLPAFDRKVVRGYFTSDAAAGFPEPDQVFVVTHLVRDTTVAAVGR